MFSSRFREYSTSSKLQITERKQCIPLRCRSKQFSISASDALTLKLVAFVMSSSSPDVASDHSSDDDIPSKVEWLRSADGYIAHMIEICEIWLPDENLALPCELEDKALIEHLIRDVAEHVASSKALRATIAALLQREDTHMSIHAWREIKSKCMMGEMEMETLFTTLSHQHFCNPDRWEISLGFDPTPLPPHPH